MKNKIIAFLSLAFAIALMMTVFTFSTSAAETSDPQLSFTSFDVKQGSTFTTTLYFEKGSNVCQASLSMTYDTDKVELLNCEVNEDAVVEPTINTTTAGKVRLSFGSGQNINAKINLIDLTFKVSDTLGEGQYNLLTVLEGETFVRRLNVNAIVENVSYRFNTPLLNIYRAGDMNLDGEVNGMDAVYILRYEAGLTSGREGSSFYLPYYEDINDYNDHQRFILSVADAYYDGVVNGSDAVSILRHEAGFTEELLGNRVNVTFYDGNNRPFVIKSVLFGDSLTELPDVPAKDGFSGGAWSLSMSELVEPNLNNLERNISVFAYYDSDTYTTSAMEFYKKLLVEKYYKGDLATGLSSDLDLISTIDYQGGYRANLIWSSDSNYVLNSTTGKFTKPTYPQNLNLSVRIISYDSNNMIEAEDSLDLSYQVDGIYRTPTKAEVEDFLKFYFTDESDGNYRVNYDVKPITKVNNTVIPVEGALYDNFEIRLAWYQNINGTLQPISQIKRTTSSQVNDYVAVATFNGKPVDEPGGDGKIYIDDVEVTAIDQLEVKNYIISQIANMGSLATDGKILWNNDTVYGSTVTWQTGNADIAYVANSGHDQVVQLKDDAITGTTLPINAVVTYPVDGGIEEFVLSYNLTVSCNNTIIKAPENMDPGLYKAIKMELEDTLGYRGDLTSAALTNVKFVNLDLSRYQKMAKEYEALRAKYPEQYPDDTYPEITSFRGLSYCKNLRTLNISGITVSDASMNQIATLSYLEAFIARGCNLDNLSDGGSATLKNATGLKLLDLTDNNFTSLDSVFEEGVRYGSLREVYLSKNRLTDINALSRAPMMTYLSLSDNGLTTEGTASVANYPYLLYLSLANNNIDSVEHIQGLRNLKELRLQNNNISNVNVLRKLINLEILYLGHNRIQDVTYLNNLTKLQVLYVNDNRISDISGLRNLTKLEVINVSNNNLSSLSTLIDYKSTLTEIYAENNRITDFSFINGAEQLHILMLSGNHVELEQENMVTWLSALPEIEILTLSDIALSDLSFLDSMSKLVRLDVANCGLRTFKDEISNIKCIADRYEKLRILDISNNDFSDNAEELMRLRNITLLSILYADNICNNLDAYTLTYSMTELKYISLENCGISSMNWLYKFNGLVYVDLAGNNISDVNLEAYISNASMKTLEELYLDTNVPCTFANAFNIADLNLSKLSLEGVSIKSIERMPRLENIKYLNIDNTGLTNLTGNDPEMADTYSIAKYTTLETVDVSHLEADISLLENMPSINTVYAVGTTDSKRFYENNLHSLQRLYNKGITCYLYDKDNVYRPQATVEGVDILNLLDDISTEVTVAADNEFSDNNPFMVDEINDFDITWTVSNSDNYEIVNNHLSVKDYTGLEDETLTITATITVYPDQAPVSRNFTIKTKILRASPEYYEITANNYSESLTRSTSFDITASIKANQTDNFKDPVKPVVDDIIFTFAAKLPSGENGIFGNTVVVSPLSFLALYDPMYGKKVGYAFEIKPVAVLGSSVSIKIDICHTNKNGETVYDIDSVVLPVTIASRTFTATFEMDGGTITDSNNVAIESREFVEDALVFENLNYTKPGYEFKGWYRDSDFTDLFSADGSGAIMPSENITLYAKWQPLSYNIILDPNDGTVETDSISALSDVEIGELPVPTRQYYTFDGWFTALEGGTQVTEKTKFARTDDITLYAHWTLNSFMVTFNANGGTVETSSLRGYCGVALGELPTPTRDYYSFDGWFTEAKGGEEITAETVYDVAQDVTVYAHWQVNSYRVSWDTGTGYTISVSRTASPNAGAGTGQLSNNAVVYYGDQISVTYTALTGYSLSVTGITSATVSGNITSSSIYASASLNSYTYNIVYKSSNGTNLGSTSITAAYGSSKTVSAPSKSGYDTPSAQNVVWDSTAPKTIVFVYKPSYVASTTTSGAIGSQFGYNATLEYRNRTASTVEVRVVFTITIYAYQYNTYGHHLGVWTNAGSSGVDVVSFGSWKSSSSGSRSATGSTGWMTVNLGTTNKTTASIGYYHYQFNYNGTDMYAYNGTPHIEGTFGMNIPAY